MEKLTTRQEYILQVIKTDAPFLLDKISDYKKEIWNEALTYLGINNILVDKKERLITDEANSNNELINLNLQSMLAPRQDACRQFNEKYGFNILVENLDAPIQYTNISEQVAKDRRRDFLTDLKNYLIK